MPGGSTTTTTVAPTTTTTVPKAKSDVPVLVVNASGQAGAAATVTNELQLAGWNVQAPMNATANVSTSAVYYVSGQKAAAEAVAATLHLPASAVLPYTTAAPVEHDRHGRGAGGRRPGPRQVGVGHHDDPHGHLSGAPGAVGLPRGAEALLAPLVADPARTALLCDFDGTLAPIVEDPASARPLDGVPGLLADLARRFAVVGVVSGRPAAFLVDRLAGPGRQAAGVPATDPAASGQLHLVGLYGMESVDADGLVRARRPGRRRGWTWSARRRTGCATTPRPVSSSR